MTTSRNQYGKLLRKPIRHTRPLDTLHETVFRAKRGRFARQMRPETTPNEAVFTAQVAEITAEFNRYLSTCTYQINPWVVF